MGHSAITDNEDYCVECGRPRTCWHHCLYGRFHKLADKDRLTVPMCTECHTYLHSSKGTALALKYKRIAEATYIQEHGFDAYMERYGKNYLE